MNLFDELMELVKQLDDDGVDYALAGGLAVAVWGAPRATKDIDMLVRKDALERALATAAKKGFVIKAFPQTFRDGMELQRVTRAEAGALLTLDFILVNEALEAAWTSRTKLDTGGGCVWVISRDALIAMKAAAARPIDIADIEKLREIDR